MMTQNPNLKEFFEDGFYEDYWGWKFTEENSQKQTEQILELLEAKHGHILDWCGGWGTHSIYFAEKGFKVTLLDFVGRYLKKAKKKFQEKGLKLSTIETDCRNTPASIQADFATCIGNAVGFLEEVEQIKAFKSLYSAIKPNGRIVVDVMNILNPSFISRILAPVYENNREDGYVFRQYNKFYFETNVLHSVFEIVNPNGCSVSKEFNQTLYTPRDLAELVSKAGFKFDNIYGSFDGDPISFESPNIILVAHK